MREVKLNIAAADRRRILCLGAHSDDIEIGCGGTILRLLQENPNCTVHWVVLSGIGPRGEEARVSAEQFLHAAAEKQIHRREFRDGFFPHDGIGLKEYFEELKRLVNPDIIFTHCQHDLHQDHRMVWELTWNTWRDHLILEYEIPKYDGDLGNPNLFVPIDEPLARQKTDILLSSFVSQRSKRWFTDDTFLALMRLRAVQAGVTSRYVEAFYARKIILG
jgi:LmbE family N-acetylglucosaminyl deacetylase